MIDISFIVNYEKNVATLSMEQSLSMMHDLQTFKRNYDDLIEQFEKTYDFDAGNAKSLVSIGQKLQECEDQADLKRKAHFKLLKKRKRDAYIERTMSCLK